MEIIAFAGKARAGKDTSAAFAAEFMDMQLGRNVVFLSLADDIKEALAEQTKDLPKEVARPMWIAYGKEMRDKHGPEYFGKQIASKIKSMVDSGDHDNTTFIINDVRLVEEAEALKDARIPLKVILIKSPLSLRMERFPDNELAMKYLKDSSSDKTETSFDRRPHPLAYIDTVIQNDSTEEALRSRLRDYLYQDFYFGG